MFKTIKFNKLLTHFFSVASLRRDFSGKHSDKESFLNGDSANYLEHMYVKWVKNPEKTNETWRRVFQALSEVSVVESETKRNIYEKEVHKVQKHTESIPIVKRKRDHLEKKISKPHPRFSTNLKDHLLVQLLIRSYQVRGHLISTLDPLNLWRKKVADSSVPHKCVRRQHPVPNDKMAVFLLPQSTAIGDSLYHLSLNSIVERLHKTYCENIGVEYAYVTTLEKCQFIRDKLESPSKLLNLTLNQRKEAMIYLTKATIFEDFLNENWPLQSKFSLEGCEALIPSLNILIKEAIKEGADSFNIGMAARGRLNVLANIFQIGGSEIFYQFGKSKFANIGSNDWKYHLGCLSFLETDEKKKYRISLVASPSQLESVNPIVMGKTKAEQFYSKDKKGSKVWPIIIHSDAAMCGQGVIYETLHLSQLPSFSTFGTVHLVINNQISFATDPLNSRSSEYCTDVAKVISAPVFHVNADDIDAVLYVSLIAAQYRAKFKEDVIVDLVGYRRHGYSGGDDPALTQPKMYARIKETLPVFTKYLTKLTEEKVVDVDLINDHKKSYLSSLKESLKSSNSSSKKMDKNIWIDSPWVDDFKIIKHPKGLKTGEEKDILLKIGKAFSSYPKDFTVHKALQRVLKQRVDSIARDSLDWAMCEAFAIGSVLLEGAHVRLSGEDVERGTFSHRHHVVHHQNEDKVFFNPLTLLDSKQGTYTISNSSLSEFAVTGFELGYSRVNPNALVMWEAQFGDFVNTAQCIVDQFIATGEFKWLHQSGIVLLLPHGLEGQGPEHSSGRPERMLQLCGDNEDHYEGEMSKQLRETNIIVVNPSTPANYYHVLRRQLRLPFRKPLIVFSPKSLLRHPNARSSFAEMGPDTEFLPYINDVGVQSGPEVKKVLLCCGKLYYDLVKEREKRNLSNKVAISRVEQVAPFPYQLIKEDLLRFPDADVFWVQEEHRNQGWWSYVQHRLRTVLGLLGRKTDRFMYIGRHASASPAAGAKLTFIKEWEKFMSEAMVIKK